MRLWANVRNGEDDVSRKWPLAVAILIAAIGLVVFKQVSKPKADELPSLNSPHPTVLLFADLSEAETSDGCGQIIRLVRAAASRGVPVREVAPGQDAALTRTYRVTVNPTVLILDAGGRVVVRHEGEASAVIEAIRAGLDRQPGTRK